MKPVRQFVVLFAMLFVTMTAYADAVEPVISYNVHVVKNATPAQCPASWEGDIAPDTEVIEDGAGSQTDLTSPGVRSCTSCSVDKASGDCVCGTCYDHFDE